MSREKEDCFFLDDGFAAELDARRELSAGRFRLLRPGDPRIDDEQRSAFGELFRQRISFGADYCDRPHFRGFRIDVDHEACVVQVTVRIALRRPDRWLHVPGGEEFALLCAAVGPEECDAEIQRHWQEAVDDRKPHWKRVIEETWSDKFRLVPVALAGGVELGPWTGWDAWLRTVGDGTISNCESYLIRVVVEWVDPDSLHGRDLRTNLNDWDPNVDYIVTVQWGGGGTTRDDAFYWHLDMYDGSVAHEFGHLMGNPDEYDGTCDGCPDRPIVDGSLMNSLTMWPQGVMAHHFFLVAYWMWSRTCTAYAVRSTTPGYSAGDFWLVTLEAPSVDVARFAQKITGIACP